MSFEEARATASGKWILFGEHFVVEGAPAIAWPLLTRRLEAVVRVEAGARGRRISGPYVNEDTHRLVEGLLAEGATTTREAGLSLDIRSDIPPGQGLGSSAALVIALDAALAQLELSMGPSLDRSEPNDDERYRSLEGLFHQRSSGLDVAVVRRGGALRFEATSPGTSRWVPVTSPPPPVVLLLGQAPRSTRGAQGRAKPMGPLIDDYRAVLRAGEGALRRAELPAIGQAMDENQRLLEALGVVTSEEQARLEQARRLGALGAKICGAGGGGAVAVLHEDPRGFLEAAARAGLQTVPTRPEEVLP